MADKRSRRIFPHLPVRDLDRSKAFFSALGFELDPKFSDEKTLCLVINDQASVMLLVEPFFRTFTLRELCDTSKYTEGMLLLTCDSRAEVDDIVKQAIAAGGKHAKDPQDHGFMYGWSFYDLDGHHWEVLWMDPQAVQ